METAAPLPTTVYYHADCLDGFGAAFAAWRRLGDDARYMPLHHGEPWQPADVAGRRVYLLDISLPPPALRALARRAAEVCLIDHHVTARDQWAALLQPDGSGAECAREGNLQLHLDLSRSGAHLAWRHFHPDQPLPRLLAHVEDQDLWRFELPDTRAVCRLLRLRPFDFAEWQALLPAVESDAPAAAREALLAEGRAVDRFLQLEVQRLAEGHLVRSLLLPGEAIDPLQARRHGIPLVWRDGQAHRALQGLAVNASALFASALGTRLALQSGGFGLVWQEDAAGMVKVSLRADGAVNVARLAEAYGGGGHPNAAGFRMEALRFREEVLGGGAGDSLGI